MSNGFTGKYELTGVVHRGEYVVPMPYDYPKWWIAIQRYVKPARLRGWINRKVRVYNPYKDLFFQLTGKRVFDEDDQ